MDWMKEEKDIYLLLNSLRNLIFIRYICVGVIIHLKQLCDDFNSFCKPYFQGKYINCCFKVRDENDNYTWR